MNKSSLPNEIIYINDDPEVCSIEFFCRPPAMPTSATKTEAVNYLQSLRFDSPILYLWYNSYQFGGKTRPNKYGPLHQIFDKAIKENGPGLLASFGGLKKG